MLNLFFAAIVAQTPPAPARPPDGTYVYAVSQGRGPVIFTTSIVVKTSGSTFEVSESAKLPNGATASTLTSWDAATMLPLHYEVHQGNINLSAPVTPKSIRFSGAPLYFAALPGTKFMVVSEGLNSLRMMLPFVVAAHAGEAFTVAQINGNRAVQGGGTAASPPPGGVKGDAVRMFAVESEQIAAWLNPQSGVVDEEIAMPGDSRMRLVRYTPR